MEDCRAYRGWDRRSTEGMILNFFIQSKCEQILKILSRFRCRVWIDYCGMKNCVFCGSLGYGSDAERFVLSRVDGIREIGASGGQEFLLLYKKVFEVWFDAFSLYAERFVFVEKTLIIALNDFIWVVEVCKRLRGWFVGILVLVSFSNDKLYSVFQK